MSAPFLVMCGMTRDPLDVRDDEDAALALALEHDRAHHCSPWVQVPLATEPAGVRAIYSDGSLSDALPLLYVGPDEDGVDTWEGMLPDHRLPVEFAVEVLPARTSIKVLWPHGEDTR